MFTNERDDVFEKLATEILDFGYPQNCEPDVLKSFITMKGLQEGQMATMSKEISDAVTGAVNWRKPGIKVRGKTQFCLFLLVLLTHLTRVQLCQRQTVQEE